MHSPSYKCSTHTAIYSVAPRDWASFVSRSQYRPLRLGPSLAHVRVPRTPGAQFPPQALHKRLLLLQLLAQLQRARARVDLLAKRHVHEEVAQLDTRAQARAQLNAPVLGC